MQPASPDTKTSRLATAARTEVDLRIPAVPRHLDMDDDHDMRDVGDDKRPPVVVTSTRPDAMLERMSCGSGAVTSPRPGAEAAHF